MKCSVCGKEFGDGDRCQNCGADRVSALGNYYGYNGYQNRNDAPHHVSAGSQSNMILCWHCGEPIPSPSKCCPMCGVKLHVQCPHCRNTYSSQYHLCPECGKGYYEPIVTRDNVEEIGSTGWGIQRVISKTPEKTESWYECKGKKISEIYDWCDNVMKYCAVTVKNGELYSLLSLKLCNGGYFEEWCYGMKSRPKVYESFHAFAKSNHVGAEIKGAPGSPIMLLESSRQFRCFDGNWYSYEISTNRVCVKESSPVVSIIISLILGFVTWAGISGINETAGIVSGIVAAIVCLIIAVREDKTEYRTDTIIQVKLSR